MEIKIFGYEVRVEVAIACVIIGMVMGLMMFCDCFQYSLIEGMTKKNKTTYGKREGFGLVVDEDNVTLLREGIIKLITDDEFTPNKGPQSPIFINTANELK